MRAAGCVAHLGALFARDRKWTLFQQGHVENVLRAARGGQYRKQRPRSDAGAVACCSIRAGYLAQGTERVMPTVAKKVLQPTSLMAAATFCAGSSAGAATIFAAFFTGTTAGLRRRPRRLPSRSRSTSSRPRRSSGQSFRQARPSGSALATTAGFSMVRLAVCTRGGAAHGLTHDALAVGAAIAASATAAAGLVDLGRSRPERQGEH